MTIGLMGGTFNPVHLGHLIMAQQLAKYAGVDKVLFIPCAQPPHKPNEQLADKEDRLAMLKLAVADNPLFEISDIEISTEGKNYSVDTVKKLKGLYVGQKLCFFIGEDSLVELNTWKGAAELVELCTFVTARRFLPSDKLDAFVERNTLFSKKTVDILLQNIVETKVIDISSSDIRNKIQKKESISYLVPKEVEAYINQKQLYRKI